MRRPLSLPAPRPAAPPGFTLVEVLIGSSLGAFVLAGVLSSFLMLARNGQRMYQYAGLATDSRRALEELAQDARMASRIVWNSANSITLTVPDNYTANGNQVTYAHDPATIGATAGCFFRRPGDSASSASPTILARHVRTCTYARFDRLGADASTDPDTKRIQLRLQLRTVAATTEATTENAISATFILRNKTAN